MKKEKNELHCPCCGTTVSGYIDGEELIKAKCNKCKSVIVMKKKKGRSSIDVYKPERKCS